MDDETTLLESLLQYALEVLGADHATFCEVENSPERITVVAASGSMTHPEVLPGLGSSTPTSSATTARPRTSTRWSASTVAATPACRV